MWVFNQSYPEHIKLIFLSLFSSQFLANYVVVQRWVLSRDIIKEVPLRTVTSCIMDCSGMAKCAAVGFRKDPDTSKNDKCLLVKLLRKKNKNATRIKIFALVDRHSALEDEKEERLALTKQQACPVDVNGGYGNWSNFTVCLKSCGSGLQLRNRSCDHPTSKFGGRNCSVLGKATEQRSCSQNPCPLDGGYGEWSSYGNCSKVCSTGKQQRNRSCDKPTPQYGGKNCTSLGSSSEARSCNTHPCRQGKIQLINPHQSSTYGVNHALKALDGNLKGFDTSGGCAETNKVHDTQWWSAELTNQRTITVIRILPRFDCCRERFTHVTTHTSIDGNKWTICADVADQLKTVSVGSWVEATCTNTISAKYVKIVLHNKELFALCEVEVWGYL